MHGHHKHDHHHDHHDERKGNLLVVILLNSVITAAEFIGGALSGSLALVSDAWHNLSDVLSLLLGYAGEKISARNPSRRYTFGFKRFEVLVALINALTLLVIGIYIIHEAIDRITRPVTVDLSVMFPVGCIGLGGNALSLVMLFRKRKENLNMRAAFMHLFYDTLSSIAVLAAAAILFFTGMTWADLAASIIIAVMIFWSSLEIIRESIRIFLQGVPGEIDPDEVYRRIIGLDGVASLHGLHIWSVNSTEIFLSCHVCTDRETNPETDTLIRNINELLEHEFGITHTTIQVETTLLCSVKDGECCR
jgi:cobalt-zinc-cadmium efflux system protein